MKVFKYPIPTKDSFSLLLPKEAKILAVQTQKNNPCIWALVDTNAPNETRRFRLAGTGHPIDENMDDLNYIGTFQMLDGVLIWHLFEILQ